MVTTSSGPSCARPRRAGPAWSGQGRTARSPTCCPRVPTPAASSTSTAGGPTRAGAGASSTSGWPTSRGAAPSRGGGRAPPPPGPPRPPRGPAPPRPSPPPAPPEPPAPRSVRYADMHFTPDGTRIYAVRERHQDEGEPVNDLVVLPAGGSTGGSAGGCAEPVAVAGGHDFCSTPRVSPDGTT